MEQGPFLQKIRALLFPAMVVVAFGAYQIAQAPPEARRGKIFAAVVAFAAFVVIAVLTVRKQISSPENPRVSRWTVVWISLVLIILALLSAKL
jgi:uncharacterized membrane protein YfcA